MVIVSVNHCLRELDVQSGPFGDKMLRSRIRSPKLFVTLLLIDHHL